jgi:hypothetical protein
MRRSILTPVAVVLLLLTAVVADGLPEGPKSVASPAPRAAAAAPVRTAAAVRAVSPRRTQSLVPYDPNYGEHIYQEALLALGKGNKKEAVQYLRLYLEIGANNRQIAAAAALIAENPD